MSTLVYKRSPETGFLFAVVFFALFILTLSGCSSPLSLAAYSTGRASLSLAMRTPPSAASSSGSRVLSPETSSINLLLAYGSESVSVTLEADAEGVYRAVFQDLPAGTLITFTAEAFESGSEPYARGQVTSELAEGANSLVLALFPLDSVALLAGTNLLANLSPATLRYFKFSAPYAGDWSVYASGVFDESYAWGADGRLLASYTHGSGVAAFGNLGQNQAAWLGLRNTDEGSASLRAVRRPDGILRSDFADAGHATVPGASIAVDETIEDMARLSDGRIVAVGNYDDGTNIGGFLAMYTADGLLDTSFSGGLGWMEVAEPDSTDFWVDNVEIQPGTPESIMVAGRYNDGTGTYWYFVTRYSVTGELDLSFGSGADGFAEFSCGSDALVAEAVPADVVCSELGDDIYLGCYRQTAAPVMGIYHLNSSGGYVGEITLGSGNAINFAKLAVDSSGNVYMAATRSDGWYISKLTAVTLDDTDFGAYPQDLNGDTVFFETAYISLAGPCEITDIRVEVMGAKERVFITGSFSVGGYPRLALAALDCDTGSFFTGGLFTGDGMWQLDTTSAGGAVAADGSGNILVAGALGPDLDASVYNLISFNGGNPVLLYQEALLNTAYASGIRSALALGSGGFLLGGYADSAPSGLVRDPLLVSLSSGNAVPDFVYNHTVSNSSFVFNDQLVDPNSGKIIAVGHRKDLYVSGLSNQYAVIARFNPDGSLDTGFNGTGYREFGSNEPSSFNALAVDPASNDIVAVGYSSTPGQGIFIARVQNSGGVSDGLNTSVWSEPEQTYNGGGWESSDARAVVCTEDGQVYVGGYYYFSVDHHAIVWAYDAAGAVQGAPFDLGLYGSLITVSDLALDSAGQPHAVVETGTSATYHVCNYNVSEWTELGFEDILAASATSVSSPNLVLQPDGTARIAVLRYDGTTYSPYIERWNSSSWTLLSQAAGPTVPAGTTLDLVAHPDGSFYVSANYLQSGQPAGKVFKVLPDSSFAATGFGSSGAYTLPTGLTTYAARSIALTPAGDIVLAGQRLNRATNLADGWLSVLR